jgi:hypothetical protein
MNQALVADGAKPVPREEAMSGQPDKGHYIAMMVGAVHCLNLTCCCRGCQQLLMHTVFSSHNVGAATTAPNTCCTIQRCWQLQLTE